MAARESLDNVKKEHKDIDEYRSEQWIRICEDRQTRKKVVMNISKLIERNREWKESWRTKSKEHWTMSNQSNVKELWKDMKLNE